MLIFSYLWGAREEADNIENWNSNATVKNCTHVAMCFAFLYSSPELFLFALPRPKSCDKRANFM